MTDNISEKDKKDWETFLSSKEKLSNKDDIFKKEKHPKTKSIEKFIIKSYEESINKLIVVTGKGLHSQNEKDPYVSKELGILKYSLPEFIKKNDDLMRMINKIEDAKIEDGGSGAFYIFLKKAIK